MKKWYLIWMVFIINLNPSFAQKVWTGLAINDNSWNNANNWAMLSLPNENDDVLIPLVASGNYPNIQNIVQVSTLEVIPGASFSFSFMGKLRVNDLIIHTAKSLELNMNKKIEVLNSLINASSEIIIIDGHMRFTGNESQSVYGSFSLNDVEINAKEVIFHDEVLINGNLDVKSNSTVAFHSTFNLGNVERFNNRGTIVFEGGFSNADGLTIDFDKDRSGLVVFQNSEYSFGKGTHHYFANIRIESGASYQTAGVIDIAGTASTNGQSGALTILDGGMLFQSDNKSVNFTLDVVRIGNDHRKEYSYFSTPARDVNASLVFPNSNPEDFYKFDAASQSWVRMPSLNVIMEVGTGYAITPNELLDGDSAEIFIFTGLPNNGLIPDIPVNSAGLGANLIGNPYPSPIDINAFLLHNSNELSNNVYVWQAANGIDGGAYLDKIDLESGVIGSCQGFFVMCTNTGTIDFKQEHRTDANGNPFYRMDADPELRLSITNGDGFNDNIMLYFPDNSSPDYDAFYDAVKLKYSSQMEFYSILEADSAPRDYVFQALGPLNKTRHVPLGIDAYTSLDMTLHLDSIINIDESVQIFLIDHQEGVSHDLRLGDYSFVLSERGESTGRFEIRITPSAIEIEENNKDEHIQIQVANSELTVQANNGLQIKDIQFFDTAGRLLMSNRAGQSMNTWTMPVSRIPNGISLIQVRDTDGGITGKKIAIIE